MFVSVHRIFFITSASWSFATLARQSAKQTVAPLFKKNIEKTDKRTEKLTDLEVSPLGSHLGSTSGQLFRANETGPVSSFTLNGHADVKKKKTAIG